MQHWQQQQQQFIQFGLLSQSEDFIDCAPVINKKVGGNNFLFVCCCRVAAHRVRRIPAICFLEQKICGGDGREQWEAWSWCLRTLRLACGMWRPISDVAFRAFCAFPCVQSILESCVGRLFGVSIRQNSTSANRRWRHTKNLLFFCIIFFYMVKCNCVWGPPSGYE